jgi:hypothetical protein
MASDIGRPDVAFGVNSKAMWRDEETFAKTPYELSFRRVFRKHWLNALKKEYMSVSRNRDASCLTKVHAAWEFKKVGMNAVANFWYRLKCGKLLLCKSNRADKEQSRRAQVAIQIILLILIQFNVTGSSYLLMFEIYW